MTLASITRAALGLTAAAVLAGGAAPAMASPPGSTAILDQPDGFADPFKGAAASSGVSAGDAISADGRYVVFSSRSDGLSGTDDDRVNNIYRKDRDTGAIELISVATDGTPAHADSFDAQISDDGGRVAFVSAAGLHPDAKPGVSHVYVRDVAAGTTTLAMSGR